MSWTGADASILIKKPRQSNATPLRLLNRRKQPLAVTRAHEGPQFGGLTRPAPIHGTAARAFDHLINEGKAHGDSRIVDAALAPGFRKVALLEFDAADLVDKTAARIFGELLGKIRQHLRCHSAAQSVEIFCRIRGLDFAKQALKRIIIRFTDGERLTGWRVGG